MTGEDIRISAPSCALRLACKSRRSFRPWPLRVCAHVGKGPHGSALLSMAWHGCTAVWTGGQSTIAMRHIAWCGAEIRRRASRLPVPRRKALELSGVGLGEGRGVRVALGCPQAQPDQALGEAHCAGDAVEHGDACLLLEIVGEIG